MNGLTQFAGISSAALQEQDGYMAGTLQSATIPLKRIEVTEE